MRDRHERERGGIDALDAAIRDSAAAGLPAIQVSPAQGKLLHLIAKVRGARRILEVGTLGGYSTLKDYNLGRTNYLGVSGGVGVLKNLWSKWNGIFGGWTNTKMGDILDGSSNTFAFGEASGGERDSVSFRRPQHGGDSLGNLYYGIRTTGTAPAPLNTTAGFVVRYSAAGVPSYVDTVTATGDVNVQRVTHGSALGLSNDEQSLYVAMKGTTSTTTPFLVAMNASTLGVINKVALTDPRNGFPASITDVSTASPMVAPDNDVYFGVQANPYNGSRGWLLRFNADLTVQKTPGGFGWDYTAGIVPASMIPDYHGTSTYLLFCKYNNYANITDGDGINKLAILDPNREIDSRYVNQLVTLKNGRITSGLTAVETAGSLTLKRAEGVEEVLLRGQIDTVEATGQSLMPEGLEKEIPAEAMADLLAYLIQQGG